MRLALLLAALAPADDPPAVAVRATRAPAAVFADAPAEFGFAVTPARAGRVAWRFAVGGATVAAKELDLADTLSLKVPMPHVRDGVVLAGRLTVSVTPEGADRPAAVHDHDVSVFPSNPFAGRAAWLKELRLTVHDPERATAKALAALGVPFDDQPNPAALADLAGGVLVVGEGTSFKESPGLAELMAKLAARGVAVLVLAPADGELVLPESSTVRDLTFRHDIARRLDKRLDPFPARPLQIAEAPKGWTWAEARGRGRWAAVGHPVVAAWADGPSPRYLFARLLEHLTRKED